MSPPPRALVRRRPDGERGAAAVEFALVSLLLFTIVFGIIEFSLVMRDKIAVTSAVRASGRLASAEPRSPGYADPATNTPASITGLVPDAVKAVAGALTGIPEDSIKAVWVFQSGADGLPANGNALPSGNGSGVCATNCVSYTYDPQRQWSDPSTTPATLVTGGFTRTGGSWPASVINACPGDPAGQAVGVYLQVKHKFILGGFVGGASALDLSDNTSFKFEPIPKVPGPCKP